MSSLAPLIEAYLEGPQLLRRSVAGMTREQLLSRPVPGKWSTQEVVCHLVDSDQAWIHRIKRVIAEDKPLLIGYDEARFPTALGYNDRNVEAEPTLLDLMRRQMASILRKLPDAALSRVGIHSERGSVTLEEMIKIENDHILHHVRFVLEKRRALGLPVEA